MVKKYVLGKTLDEWCKRYPLIEKLIQTEECFWINPSYCDFEKASHNQILTKSDVIDTEKRLDRFASYIEKAFPETKKSKGIIESPLIKINNMKNGIKDYCGKEIKGTLMLKCDNQLPIAGSIKARGGIYEVLKHAEDLALENGLLTINDDYSKIFSDDFKKFYSNYSIAVGSTGNLGLSIGIMSAALGFKVTVHMSHDAKQWKKDLLRKKGVTVVEYSSDYSKAVEEGRKQSLKDPNGYFVDDENSKDLFLGYSVAAMRVKKQLDKMSIRVDDDNPLFVYLPCGIGGGPGGVSFGLKQIYGDNVHCFFAEPTHSPAMLMGLLTGLHDKISVQDFGIDNVTEADGLAVGKPSSFVGKIMEKLLSGIYTVQDDDLYRLLTMMIDTENIYLEPSALAGVLGPIYLYDNKLGYDYVKKNRLIDKMDNSTHICWATGGNLVPKDIMNQYYKKGKSLL